ncbi:MAG TPA: AraC family transcriptional regulator, partial [Parachlamydiaceae bacterium]|nr:AraC family transcriptional regulator [Parachlamydiaceae bacterium]
MNSMQRINKVIDFIGRHFSEELTLDQLSSVSCFSKYHFHRLFTAHTGLSLQQYIRWLRIKKAAHQLIIFKNRNILDIALDAGFESHESFTRAFKQMCGLNPSDFRREQNWKMFLKILNENKEIGMTMKQTTEQLAEIKVVGISARTNIVDEVNWETGKIFPSVKKYFHQGMAQFILGRRKPGTTLCVYTDYKPDQHGNCKGEFTYLIGEEVESFEGQPAHMQQVTIPVQTYEKFTCGPAPM